MVLMLKLLGVTLLLVLVLTMITRIGVKWMDKF